jgi:hypothetical protein
LGNRQGKVKMNNTPLASTITPLTAQNTNFQPAPPPPKEEDEAQADFQKHKAIETAHHIADAMLGPVGGMVAAMAMHTGDMASGLASGQNKNYDPGRAALAQPHLTLNNKVTVKPLLTLEEPSIKPKAARPPSEKIVAEAEKSYQRHAVFHSGGITPVLDNPFAPPSPLGMGRRKRKKNSI